MGAKKKPFYRLVVADARSPRDGRFIEQLGIYDPLTSPATIRIDGPKVQEWLAKGAQPSDAARSLLQREGIIQGVAIRHPKAVNVGAVKKEPKPAAKRVEAERVEAEPTAAAAVAEPEVAADAEPEVAAEAEPEVVAEAEPEVAAEAEAEAVAEAEPEVAAEAEQEPAAEAAVEEEKA
jgi:small subunit ribosomal protein S16